MDEAAALVTTFSRDRGPNKRRLKPNALALQHLLAEVEGSGGGGGGGDSSSSDESDEDWVAPEAMAQQTGSCSSSGSSSSSDAGASSADGSDSEEEEVEVAAAGTVATVSAGGRLPTLAVAPGDRFPKTNLCAICVSKTSSLAEDELVQCDGCGIEVHIGCYGNDPAEGSEMSDADSDYEDEPWFCEACAFEAVSPTCCLCPNDGGAFKQTILDGQWVHVICALYGDSVAWGDSDTVSPIVISLIPPDKWCSRRCGLCRDEKYARTGMSIACDAGMCRNFFHVTCAQREGLLLEASRDKEEAQPYYAYCRDHTDKLAAKAVRKRFLAIRAAQQHPTPPAPTDAVRQRLARRFRSKFEKARRLHQQHRERWRAREPAMVQDAHDHWDKVLKRIHGLTSRQELQKDGHGSVRPALSAGFVDFYNSHESRLQQALHTFKAAKERSLQLTAKEKALRQETTAAMAHITQGNAAQKEAKLRARQLVQALQKLGRQELPLPAWCDEATPLSPRTEETLHLSLSQIVATCDICGSSDGLSDMVKCGACRRSFHIYCLDPPLPRVPTVSKNAVWQCGPCSAAQEPRADSPLSTASTDRRRKKRRIRAPKVFSPSATASQWQDWPGVTDNLTSAAADRHPPRAKQSLGGKMKRAQTKKPRQRKPQPRGRGRGAQQAARKGAQAGGAAAAPGSPSGSPPSSSGSSLELSFASP